MPFKRHNDPTHLYFVTATILGWKQLFIEPTYATIVLNSLDWHRQNNRWRLYAYVLMPNHLHTIVKPQENQIISTVLQSFGSFTAHAILNSLKGEGRHDLLAFFSQRAERDANKEHQIWQPIQAKNVYSTAFLREKLDYIHNNPVAKHWRLVENRPDYAYSSACFYDVGRTPIVQVDDVREWFL